MKKPIIIGCSIFIALVIIIAACCGGGIYLGIQGFYKSAEEALGAPIPQGYSPQIIKSKFKDGKVFSITMFNKGYKNYVALSKLKNNDTQENRQALLDYTIEELNDSCSLNLSSNDLSDQSSIELHAKNYPFYNINSGQLSGIAIYFMRESQLVLLIYVAPTDSYHFTEVVNFLDKIPLSDQ